MAPAAATPPATRQPIESPCRKAFVAAVWTAWPRAVWPAPATWPATAYAAPSDWCAVAAAARGSPAGRLAASREPYSDAYTLPITATPSVPPSSRVESLTADPTPAWRRDTAPMMDSVAGAEVRPMPSPYSTIWTEMIP